MRRPGITLAELLVAMSVMSLLMSAVLTGFLYTARLMGWVGTRSDLATSALLSLTAVSKELRASTYETITVVSSPQAALSFRVEDPNATTFLQFVPSSDLVVYYADGKGRLMRKTWSGTASLRMAPDQMATVLGQVNGTERVVAAGLTNFSIAPPTFPTTQVVDGIVLMATVEKTNGTRILQQEVTTCIRPRNR